MSRLWKSYSWAIIIAACGGYAMAGEFLQKQLNFERVRTARDHVDEGLRARTKELGLPYPPRAVFLRAFKLDASLELWMQEAKGDKFVLYKEYPICAASGVLGPKRRQGDRQVPEGFYKVRVFNPVSSYHLSLGIDYPNALDRKLSDADDLGGNIMIHGNCVTIGCIPITDALIEEVYWAAVLAKDNGQQELQAHIFPSPLTEGFLANVRKGDYAIHLPLWESMAAKWQSFETTHKLP